MPSSLYCFTRDLTDLTMGGVSAMFASLFTNPIEVVKTRMQLQGELLAKGKHVKYYKNVPHAIYVIAKNDGIAALQKGLPAMMGFQFFLNIFRLGCFRIADRRGFIDDSSGTGKKSLLKGAAVAGVGGAIGSIAGTPFFLVKTRLQSAAKKDIAVGHQHEHTGTYSALKDIYRKEGTKGLFRGVTPQIPRGMVGSASQILSFTYAKDWLRENNMFVDSPILMSFFGANLGGLIMTVCLNPFDVVATRLSNQRELPDHVVKKMSPVDAQKVGKLYNGMIDCFVKMIKNEGFSSLYKGVGANYMRLGPHTVLLLVCWDQLKILEEYLRCCVNKPCK